MIENLTKFNVRYQETDRMGVVYHSNYFIWFEVGRTELFNKIGAPYREFEKKGYFLVVTEAHCKYRAPATYDDEIEVLTKLSDFSKSCLTFEYEVKKGNTLVTTGTTKHAFVDKDGKITRVPDFFIETLSREGVLNG